MESMKTSSKSDLVVIRVPIEAELLRKSQALAKKMHISMATLISRSLRAMLIIMGRNDHRP